MPENLVIGLDGCKAGWVMVCWPHDTGKVPRATLIPTIHTALNAGASCIGVDMPIGFPCDTARLCETLARKYIGPRRSSVFPVPCRDALMADDYPGACEINAGVLGKKVPKQAFMLFEKMREIDATITPGLQSVVHEVHPEVSFCTMNNQTPLHHAKKTAEGARLRRTLLLANGFPWTGCAILNGKTHRPAMTTFSMPVHVPGRPGVLPAALTSVFPPHPSSMLAAFACRSMHDAHDHDPCNSGQRYAPPANCVVMCNAPVAARAQNSHYDSGSSTLTPS